MVIDDDDDEKKKKLRLEFFCNSRKTVQKYKRTFLLYIIVNKVLRRRCGLGRGIVFLYWAFFKKQKQRRDGEYTKNIWKIFLVYHKKL
jgi:hypothetical protein